MIKVKNLTTGHECPNIKPTIFPDQSSQVWQLPENVLKAGKFEITWYFESEAEVMHLLQLRLLLKEYGVITKLFIPFLPYARQDKEVSNDSTFALKPLLSILDSYFGVNTKIEVFDAHNPKIVHYYNIKNQEATKYIVKSLVDSQADLICFPDKGASTRYPELADFIVADKVRDQATGKILGHTLLESKHSLEGKTVLIVDDLADGGATFISVTKMLKDQGAANVDLYVSHGVFSKGVHVLKHAGIRNIYTTDSFIGSSEMSKSMCTIYKLEE